MFEIRKTHSLLHLTRLIRNGPATVRRHFELAVSNLQGSENRQVAAVAVFHRDTVTCIKLIYQDAAAILFCHNLGQAVIHVRTVKAEEWHVELNRSGALYFMAKGR